MTVNQFDESLRRLLVHEGGYTDHPSDPGGPTKFGITIHDFRKYVKPNATAADVRGMDVATASDIYRAKYWQALRCDELAPGLDYAVFDYGVNSGTARAAKVLHRLLGLGAAARITDAAVAAAKRQDTASLVSRLCDERLAFLKSLKTWPVFGKGWGRRVSEVRAAALAMTRGGSVAAQPRAAPAKGAAKINKGAQAASAGTIVLTGAAGAALAREAGTAMSSIVAILIATAVLAALGWIAWRSWRDRQQVAPADAASDLPKPAAFARLREMLKGWKTVLFGTVLTAAGTALDLLDQLKAIDITPLLPPNSAVKIIAGIGIATILLRLATTGRIGQKDG